MGEGHLLLVVGAEAGDDVLRERELEGPSRGEPGEKPGEADSEAKGGQRDGHLRWHGSWSVQRERSEHRKRDDDPTQQDGESKSDQRREEGDDGRLDEEETPDAADGDAAGPQYREFSPPTREAQIESHSAEQDGDGGRRDREREKPDPEESHVRGEILNRGLQAPERKQIELVRRQGGLEQRPLAHEPRGRAFGIVGVDQSSAVEPQEQLPAEIIVRKVQSDLRLPDIGRGEERSAPGDRAAGRGIVEPVNPPGERPHLGLEERSVRIPPFPVVFERDRLADVQAGGA